MQRGMSEKSHAFLRAFSLAIQSALVGGFHRSVERRLRRLSKQFFYRREHTDETGIDDTNWSLSAQRAASTYRELTTMAPELRRIINRRQEEILSISGYSSTRPIDAAETLAAWSRNRRIDLRFVMDTDATAGLEEIKGLLQKMRTAIQGLKSQSL